MEYNEVALSDVHVDLSHSCLLDCNALKHYPAELCYCRADLLLSVYVTRFTFCDNSKEQNQEQESGVDEDGDLIVNRKHSKQLEAIYIEHTLSTCLQDVGLQVWSACLYLCDYILHNRSLFKGQIVVELGSGVGLASIVAAQYTRKVFITDVCFEAIELCQRNVKRNVNYHCKQTNDIAVRRLDWTQCCSSLLNTFNEDGCPYNWTSVDIEQLYSANILLAADVIYNDDLTDAFFDCVDKLMTNTSTQKTLIISLERRLNFTVDDFHVSCPAYKHFTQRLHRLTHSSGSTAGSGSVSTTGSVITFTARQILEDICQYFTYERSNYLEIWELKTIVTNQL